MAVKSGSAGVRFPPALRLSGNAATNDFPIVLLHVSATSCNSRGTVRTGQEASGAGVLAPDMLGYGRWPAA